MVDSPQRVAVELAMIPSRTCSCSYIATSGLLEHRVLCESISFSIWDDECPPAMRTFVVSVVARSFKLPKGKGGVGLGQQLYCIVFFCAASNLL